VAELVLGKTVLDEGGDVGLGVSALDGALQACDVAPFLSPSGGFDAHDRAGGTIIGGGNAGGRGVGLSAGILPGGPGGLGGGYPSGGVGGLDGGGLVPICGWGGVGVGLHKSGRGHALDGGLGVDTGAPGGSTDFVVLGAGGGVRISGGGGVDAAADCLMGGASV
jgi:hypothetical protein